MLTFNISICTFTNIHFSLIVYRCFCLYCFLHATSTVTKILYDTTRTIWNSPRQPQCKVGHDTIKTRSLTISATLCNNHTNNFIITLLFLRFLLRSTKLARPKQTLESQFSVGPFADSVCVVSSWASQKMLSLCNSPSIKLNRRHVKCSTEQTTVIWHAPRLI